MSDGENGALSQSFRSLLFGDGRMKRRSIKILRKKQLRGFLSSVQFAMGKERKWLWNVSSTMGQETS